MSVSSDTGRAGFWFSPNAHRRLRLRLWQVNLIAAVWFIAALNQPFWHSLAEALGGWQQRPLHLTLTGVALVAWIWLQLELLTWGRFAKPVLIVICGLSAAAAYAAHTYGLTVDRTLLSNLFETHRAEALELLDLRMLPWTVIFFLVPAALLYRTPIDLRTWRRDLLEKLVCCLIALGILASVIFTASDIYAPLVRTHRELRLQLVPSNLLSALHSYAKTHASARGPLQPLGVDARIGAPAVPRGKPALTVVVIGETARAQNFSLGDYRRPTNPRLAALDLLYFQHVTSCGTSTAVSLPCMFLDTGRSRFSEGAAQTRENLLDVLRHAGVNVLWRDNNSGCKGVCARVTIEDLAHGHDSDTCNDGGCLDGVLLHGLQARIGALTSDTVVVLHMQGSHGPAYFQRYPQEFEYFRPVCHTADFSRCSRESIVNAYDNSLRYTDHVLAEIVKLLQANAGGVDASLLYVSDHGESLGERGIYLHGMPYEMAPVQQTHVPMLLWLSEGSRLRQGIDASCASKHAADSLSHDNFFHIVLGISGVLTNAYRPEKDPLHGCRTVG